MTAKVLKFPTPKNSDTSAVMLGIDYVEFRPATFRGCFAIVLRNGVEQERHDFADWDSTASFAHSLGCPVLHLSSVDNYASDLSRANA